MHRHTYILYRRPLPSSHTYFLSSRRQLQSQADRPATFITSSDLIATARDVRHSHRVGYIAIRLQQYAQVTASRSSNMDEHQVPPVEGTSGRSSQSPVFNCALETASGEQLVSLPAVYTSPTFLTLPGEIRNHIYDVLFKRDRPVQLVVCTDGKGCRPVRDGSAVLDGASLLGTCRQIYVEATGILYAQNTFNVTDVHNGFYANRLVEQVGFWLTKIGRHTATIGPIILDMNRKKLTSNDLEVFPVLRHICMPQNAGLRVTFAGACGVSFLSPRRPLVNVIMLNKAIALLKTDALLNIKRYVPFPQFNTSLVLTHDGLHGKVTHPSDNPEQWNGRCVFYVALSSIQQRPIAALSFGLEALLDIRPIRNAILRHALPEFDEFVYDLSERTLIPGIPGILGVNHALRDMCLRRIRADNVVTVLKTDKAKSSFSDQLAIFKRFPSWKTRCTAPGWHWLVPNKIRMSFELSAATKLSDLRIDAIALFEATKHFEEDTSVSVELSYVDSAHDESLSVRREVAVPLFDFQDSVVTALVVFAKRYPDRKNNKTCPSVRMDGHFLVREVTRVNSDRRRKLVVIRNSPAYRSFITEIGGVSRPRNSGPVKHKVTGMSYIDRMCLSLKARKPL
jgi:hypothetical protein